MSKDINCVVVTGRLVRDAELKMTNGGMAITSFSIAVNRSVKTGDEWKDEAQFFDVTLFGKQGEVLHPYLVKGASICVDGELKQDRWEKDGKTNSKISIVGNSVKLMGGSKGGNHSSNSEGSNQRSRDFEQNDYGYSPDAYPEDIPF